MDNYINRQFGDYRIVEEIGSGGMGRVYRARHVHLKKDFAVKILPEELAGDKSFVARFYDEARVMSDLQHSGIVEVHNMSCQDGVYFLAMDYVTGPEGEPLTLHDRLRAQDDARLPENDVRKWAAQIAEALAYAHKRGVVHRDIKPANIMIDSDGNARLTDFGLAKAIGNEFIISQIHETMQRTLSDEKTHPPTDSPPSQDTLSDQPTTPPGVDGDKPRSSGTSILGTYDYMAPEQRGEGGTIDQRTDIYSFGVLLVLRGGSWSCDPWVCRSAFRHWSAPVNRYDVYGFRVCLDSE